MAMAYPTATADNPAASVPAVSQPPEGESLEPLDSGRYAEALHAAVLVYERESSPAALDQAFVTAAAAVAALRGPHAGAPPEVEEVRRLFDQLPDFELLVSLAAATADRAAAEAGARLWDWLGFAGEPPSWDEAELARARLLVACACAPLDGHGTRWLGPRLHRLAAARWSGMILEGLRAADEQWWRGALGEHYESIRRRCAPRTTWRTRGLSALVSSDERTRSTLLSRLERWLADGAVLERLPEELEAALVQTRTPARLA
jgi:hypothetical protein